MPDPTLRNKGGRAVVTLTDSITHQRRDFHCGPWESGAAAMRYHELLGRWRQADRRFPANVAADQITIAEVIVQYWRWAKDYYSPREAMNIKSVWKILENLYGSLSAAEFGPIRLEAVRSAMVEKSWCRTNVNKQIHRLCAIFRFAARREMLPITVYQALKSIEPLKRGRCAAPETMPVKPVPDAHVDAVKPFVARQVWAMIELQRLTGARPGELCIMRTVDIDTAGKVWLYRPSDHKTAHRGHSREIRIGPKAQEILRPWLKLDTQAFIFSPAEAEADRRAKLSAARKTPIGYGNRPGTNRKAKPKVRVGDRYEANSYRHAIVRGCLRAGVDPWHPHQLRHNAATRMRREAGIEMARVLLGHRSLAASEIYAEVDGDRADAVAAEFG